MAFGPQGDYGRRARRKAQGRCLLDDVEELQSTARKVADWGAHINEFRTDVQLRLACVEDRFDLLVTLQTGTWRERRAARKKLRGLA